ncbi:MAG: indoleacetamide hydrolase [Robiginitomaculum sp.]
MKKYSVIGIMVAYAILASCSPKTPDEQDPGEQDNVNAAHKNYKNSLAMAAQNAELNAFITLSSNFKMQNTSSGRLSGMVVAVKDNIHVAGLPNTVGTDALASFIPQVDAPVITRLKEQGAIIIGKTNMHELAFGITSHNVRFGAVKNPYDQTRFPGGSSGGSAVAVAARIVPMAIGTDTGGSVRLPASLTGIIGFRPSIDRYPSGGITPISHTRDVVGPMALTMENITLLDSVMADRPQIIKAKDIKTLRLGVARNPFYKNLNSETERIMNAALDKLQKSGVRLVEVDIQGLSELNEKTSFPIALYEGTYDLEAYLEQYKTGVSFFDIAKGTQSPDVKGLFAGLAMDKDEDGHPDSLITNQVYQEAVDIHRKAMIALYKDYFQANNIDALVFPTTILPAGLIDGTEETVLHNGVQSPTFTTYIQNTDPGSNAGLPGISLPIGLTNTGLPVGLELDVLPGDDEKLLAIALSVEALLGSLPSPQLK